MVYVGVEFRDNLRGRTREFWAMLPYEQTYEEEVVAFDQILCNEFDEWVEDGVDPEWTDEQKKAIMKIAIGCGGILMTKKLKNTKKGVINDDD